MSGNTSMRDFSISCYSKERGRSGRNTIFIYEVEVFEWIEIFSVSMVYLLQCLSQSVHNGVVIYIMNRRGLDTKCYEMFLGCVYRVSDVDRNGEIQSEQLTTSYLAMSL